MNMDIQSRLKGIRDYIDELGFVQDDLRLDRKVKAVIGYIETFNKKSIEELSEYIPLSKYEEDWKRMEPSFNRAVELAKKDQSSRRLMVFNDQDFENVNQCFTHLQFISNGQPKEFCVSVYQRSGDLSKFIDDVIFFSSIIKNFEKQTGYSVVVLGVIYTHLHYEI